MPKEDCKYWDKCYQKNDFHMQKYNHPQKEEKDATAARSSNVKEHKRKRSEDEKQEATDAAQYPASDKDKEVTAKNKEKPINDKETMRYDKKATGEGCSDTNGKAGGKEAQRQEIETAALRTEALGNIAGKDYMELLHKRIKFSEQSEYDQLLLSNEFIRHKFLVFMPPDFYAFWKFANELKKNATGEQVLEHFEKQFQLQLVGAFEFLAGRFHDATIREPGDYLRHWRFFYDPPEFQTLFVRRGTGVHYGYWRDTPQDKDALLFARNDVTKSCEFEFVAGNAFDAFLYFLDKDFVGSPFTAALVANTKKALNKFIEANEVSLEKLEPLRKARNSKVVAKAFHRAGIVVPLEAKTQLGYRPLIESDAELKKILSLFEKAGSDSQDDSVRKAVMIKLQPVATAASIALDESDFGTSLELGIDLFCSGRLELHMLIQSLLVPAYTLLQRPQFIAISKAHMEKRSKELKLSIFDLEKK